MNEQFAAAPKVVKPKNKYKQAEPEDNEEEQIKLIYNNLMWDKRVFRGNTHAALVTLKNVDNQKAQGSSNLRAINQPLVVQQSSNRRAPIQIFSDQFVQSLTDKPPHYEYGSQTDALPQNPVIRHKIDIKTNVVNIETQIWDNQLFDFDYQVEPLLNVLCGRLLEVSRMEVLQEEELVIMKNRQDQLKLQQNAENRKIDQMYDDQKALETKNAKLVETFRKDKDKKIKTHKRLFSRVLAKQFFKNIKQNTLNIVERNGYFRNPLDLRILNEIPNIFYKTATQINNQSTLLISQAYKIAQNAQNSLLKQHLFAKQVEQTRRNQIIFKRQELAKQKNARKLFKQEERQMKSFLQQEKLFFQKEQELKRLREEAEQIGEQPPPEQN